MPSFSAGSARSADHGAVRFTISNAHERALVDPAAHVDALLSRLGTPDDRLWPSEVWLSARLDASPDAGGAGGHGRVRYHCSERAPGMVTFTFDEVNGSRRWNGRHRFTLLSNRTGCTLRHVVELRLPLREALQWQVLIRPLHDAILEDLLDKAAGRPPSRAWSAWVRTLRRVVPSVCART